MKYYIKTHTIKGRNRLQEAIVREAEDWNGTLVTDELAKDAFIHTMRSIVERYNIKYPLCRPCRLEVCDNRVVIATEMVVDTFVNMYVYKVTSVFDGVRNLVEEEGGEL